MRRPEIHISPGVHACLVYDAPAEQLAVAADYMRDGLAAGERCVYLVGDRRLGDVIDALEAAGVDVTREVTSGALQFDTTALAYLGGAFDPRSTIRLILAKRSDAIARGRARGHRGKGLRAATRIDGDSNAGARQALNS